MGAFLLPSGDTTYFKVECDCLITADWGALAAVAQAILPPFGVVEGVPRGGSAFAEALKQYSDPSSRTLLIADDVWVSGRSMEGYRNGRDAVGVVAIARRAVAPWVTPIFSLNPEAEAATYRLQAPKPSP